MQLTSDSLPVTVELTDHKVIVRLTESMTGGLVRPSEYAKETRPYLLERLPPPAKDQETSTRFGRNLTTKEGECLAALFVCPGATKAAESIEAALKTLEAHRTHIYAKLGVHNLSQALIAAFERGLLTKEQIPESTGVENLGRLTDRERDVFRRVAQGWRVRDIADLLGLSRKTIESHKSAMMRKLRVHRAAALTLIWLKLGSEAAAPAEE